MSFPRFFVGNPKVKNTGFPITAFGNDKEETFYDPERADLSAEFLIYLIHS